MIPASQTARANASHVRTLATPDKGDPISPRLRFRHLDSATPIMMTSALYAPGCGGRAGKVELLTGIEGASSRPVRRIVLIGG